MAVTDRVTRRSLLGALALGFSTPLLGACGGAENRSGSAAAGRTTRSAAVSTADDGRQVVQLTVGDDYVFVPDAFTVAPGAVRVTLTNEAAQLTHNFVFSTGMGPEAITEGIPYLAPGDQLSVDFEVTAVGDYRFECSFHVALGQIGTMTVSG